MNKKKLLEKNTRVKRTEKSFVHNFRAIFIDKLFSIVDFDNYELISRTQSSCQHDLYMMYFHTYIYTTNNIHTWYFSYSTNSQDTSYILSCDLIVFVLQFHQSLSVCYFIAWGRKSVWKVRSFVVTESKMNCVIWNRIGQNMSNGKNWDERKIEKREKWNILNE